MHRLRGEAVSAGFFLLSDRECPCHHQRPRGCSNPFGQRRHLAIRSIKPGTLTGGFTLLVAVGTE